MNQIALSVDVEDWYHGPATSGSSFSKYKDVEFFLRDHNVSFEKYEKPFNKVINLFNKYNVRATFFVVAEFAKRNPFIVEKIIENKHELACHGLNHSMKYDPRKKLARYSQNEFEDMTLKAKNILENISQTKIVGYRAPGAYIYSEMIDSLENLGFRYDSSVSVNSIYCKNDRKTKGVNTMPYFPKKGTLEPSTEKRSIIEFPWPYYDLLGFKFPTAGGPFLRFFGQRYISLGLKQSLQKSDTNFYFHPIDISLEKMPSLGVNRPFYHSTDGNKVLKNIEVLLDKYNEKFCTFSSLLHKYF